MGRGAWWAAVCGVGQSWTRLKRLNSSSSSHSLQLSSHHWGGGALPPRVAPGPLTGLRAPQGARSRCCLPAGRGIAASDTVQPHRRQPTRLLRPWDAPGKNTGVGCHFLLQCMKGKRESDTTLSDPMDCNLLDCSVHGIFQARVLEWGASAFSFREFQMF